MNKAVTIIIALSTATLVTTGCNTVGGLNPNIRHHQQNTVNSENPRARLVLGSGKLVNRIALTDVRLGSAGDLAKAEVTVQNLTNDRYSLEYQFAWEDSEGFSINENRVWQRFVLGPRELRSFRSIATNPRAHKFTMTVRLPDDFFIHQEKTIKDS